jgi:hypothetical protein
MNTVSPRIRWAFACLGAASLALVGCRSRGEEPPTPAATATALAAVPAPADLAAELVVANPERSWSALREALGDDAVLVPRRVGGLLVSAFGLPLRAAQEFDEKLPMVGALTVDGAMGIGIHVRDGATLKLVVSSGADASFIVEPREGVLLVRPKPEARAALVTGATLAIAGNYLVFATSDDAAVRLAPYLARTLGPRGTLRGASPPDGPVDLVLHGDGPRLAALASRGLASALDGLAPELRSAVAPFVDVEAAATMLRDALATSTGVEAALTLGKTSLRLDVLAHTTEATSSGARATIAPRALGNLRAEAVAAIALGETASARKAAARVRAAAIAAALTLRSKATPLDERKLATALDAIAEGRGDETLFGVSCSGAGATGFASGTVAARDKLEAGVTALVGLRDEPSVRRAFEGAGLVLSVERGRLERVPDEVTLVRLAPKKDDDATQKTDLRFTLGAERFAIAAGAETVDALQVLHRKEPRDTLRDAAKLEEPLMALGDRAYAAFYLDPLALLSCRTSTPLAKPSGAITAAVGPVEGGVRLRIDVAPSAFAVAGRWLR